MRRSKTLITNLLIISFPLLIIMLSGNDLEYTRSSSGRMVAPQAASVSSSAEPLASQDVPAPEVNEKNTLFFTARRVNTADQPAMPSARSAPATASTAAPDGKTLHIIQFVGPIQQSWLSAVKEAGAEPVHYVANYGYLVWAGQEARAELDRLAIESDFLRYSAPYTADLKIDPLLSQDQSDSGKQEPQAVTIQLLNHERSEESKRAIADLVRESRLTWQPVLNYQNLQALINPEAIAALAALPDVVWIGAYHDPQAMDEVQSQILAGNLNNERTSPSGPGYLEWLRDKGFSEDPADYPIIDITDDGVGTGVAETAAGDITFRIAGSPGLPSRIAYIANCTQAADGSGPDGHGHLNASIAAGYDDRSGAPYQDDDGFQRGMGVNPFGRLASTRVFDGPYFDVTACGNSYQSLLEHSYLEGARIVSNSWGCTSYSCPTTYTAAAQAYDAGVRDAVQSLPGNQQVLVLFSAGNVGSRARVGSPANAKNVIAVGATENVRPGWVDGCGYGPQSADNAQDIATFSSRGPAPGGRAKPDLVAPGTHVVGTASTAVDYNGTAICDMYHPDDQTVFAASTGTSHSVPAVAGIASLASYWLAENEGIVNPSPALLKAFLVNGADYLTGKGAGDDLPSDAQGFGLPNMERTFGDSARIIIDQNNNSLFDDSGQSWLLRVRAGDSDLPVRIVLAYTDQPGAAPVLDPRVNDLDLQVEVDDELYLGNVMQGQWSQVGGEADLVNTIEAVFLPPGQDAVLKITVVASQIAGDGVPGIGDETDQDFALVCDNCQKYVPPTDYAVYFPLLPYKTTSHLPSR